MKNYKSLGLCLLASVALFSSCESYDFGQEQYRKEINLLQNSEGVYDVQKVNMAEQTTDKGAILYLVAGISGSQKTTQDNAVKLMKDDSLFHAYNKSNYDIDEKRFAKMLPEDCYEEPALQGVIKAGESQVRFPFRIKNLESLSPDHIYFLNYKIDPDLSTPINHKKKHVLLRIHWENEFASTQKDMSYSYTSAQVINLTNSQVYRPTNAIRAYPVGANAVRFIAGNEDAGDYKKDPTALRQKSVVITIGAKKETNPLARDIVVTPHDKAVMEVKMLNPIGEYDNTILLNELVALGGGNSTFYKEFRVHYKYRLNSGDWKEVKAKLRYQYNPRADRL